MDKLIENKRYAAIKDLIQVCSPKLETHVDVRMLDIFKDILRADDPISAGLLLTHANRATKIYFVDQLSACQPAIKHVCKELIHHAVFDGNPRYLFVDLHFFHVLDLEECAIYEHELASVKSTGEFITFEQKMTRLESVDRLTTCDTHILEMYKKCGVRFLHPLFLECEITAPLLDWLRENKLKAEVDERPYISTDLYDLVKCYPDVIARFPAHSNSSPNIWDKIRNFDPEMHVSHYLAGIHINEHPEVVRQVKARGWKFDLDYILNDVVDDERARYIELAAQN